MENWHACNGCWNDPKRRFDLHDFVWCPRHAGTPRQFECTRLITVAHVKAAIRRIPAFQLRGSFAETPTHMAHTRLRI